MIHECWMCKGSCFAMILEPKVFTVSRLARTCEGNINDELRLRRVYVCGVPTKSRFVITHQCRMPKALLFIMIFEYKRCALRGFVNAMSPACRILRCSLMQIKARHASDMGRIHECTQHFQENVTVQSFCIQKAILTVEDQL